MTNAVRADVYQRITDRIVADLETGVRPWLRPWNAEHAAGRITRPLRANGIPIAESTSCALEGSAAKGFAAPIWMTYKQANERAGRSARASTAALSFMPTPSPAPKPTTPPATETENEIPFIKGYTVFNVDQIDGLPAQYCAKAAPVLDPVQRIAGAEAFLCRDGRKYPPRRRRKLIYSMTHDHVQMPPFETFRDAESYYATLAHEATHWTRHPSRLDRDFGRKRFGDEGYAVEELVAELGAAFLCADLGLTPEPRADHAAYIASWLKVLKDDRRAIFTAASHAQRAADYLNQLQLVQAEAAAA